MSVLGRFCAFVIYILILIVLSLIINGTIFPSPDINGTWYYAGIAYFLISLMTAPFFSKPTDSISTAVAGGVLLLTMGIPVSLSGASALKIGRLFAIVYCGLVILISLLAMMTKSKDTVQSKSFCSNLAFKLSDRLGGGELIFSFVFMLSVLGSLTSRPSFLLILLIFWLITLLLQPHEVLAAIIQDWKGSREGISKEAVGVVRAFENPGIALVSLSKRKSVKPGVPVGILDCDSQLRIGTAVGDLELQNERWMRVLISQESIRNQTDDGREIIPKSMLRPNTAFSLDATQMSLIQEISNLSALLFNAEEPLIGFVAEESRIDHIQIELFSPNIDVYEGRLVTTTIKGEQVLFQIVEGVTHSKALEKKSSLGYLRVRARKIGKWDNSRNRFMSVRWLPNIHTPVCLREDEPAGFKAEGIGHIPGSRFTVSLNPKIAVTHNTAILGVLGCGKTYLALELIARFVEQGTKVICLDITGQYSSQLSLNYNPTKDTKDDAAIQQKIVEHEGNVQRNIEEGGNWQLFKSLIHENINQFLKDESRYIRIYNPEGYLVRKQTGGMYKEQAAMATLTPVEVTRIISEGVLEAVSGTLSDEARVCIVFEEAHSLIPEWNSISFEGDRQSSMGTAKAILQGRKYGLGCVVVTQRTANVIKSVLNQCNTICAMRTFDATGMEFLANYIGRDYTNVLSVLEERNAVVYGRAISSDSPLIIRLNERPDFIAACPQASEQEIPDEEDVEPL